MNHNHHYIIDGGQKGADRLDILANATWPTTQTFLQRVGLRPAMRVLDLGCGNGTISMHIAHIVGPDGFVLGIDQDKTKIAAAQQRAQTQAVTHAEFWTADLMALQSLKTKEPFDFVNLRFILSHLADPTTFLKSILPHLSSQAIVAIEDVEFDGHHCSPQCTEFDDYVQLYKAAAKARGANANIGPLLKKLATDAGLTVTSQDIINPIFTKGDGKLMALITLEAIGTAAVSAKLITQNKLNAMIAGLKKFTENPTTTMSIPNLHQLGFVLKK